MNPTISILMSTWKRLPSKNQAAHTDSCNNLSHQLPITTEKELRSATLFRKTPA